MSRCQECGFDWESDGDAVAAEIDRWPRSYRAGLTRFLTGEHGDLLIQTRPAPGVWSALEYAAHVRDVVAFYLDRIERVLTQDRPTMAAADFAAMAESRRYRDEEVLAVLDAMESGVAAVSARLRSLAPEDWERVGIGSEGGERTVLVLARRLAHDGHHHLLDLGRSLRGARVPPHGGAD